MWNIRSVSPPPKLGASPERPPPMGNLSRWHQYYLDVVVVVVVLAVIAKKNYDHYGNHIPSSLGELPCLMSTGDDSSSYSSRRRTGPGSCFSSSTTTTTSKKSISPRKRSRTSRVHHIQRPCLDFEKMQQVISMAITSPVKVKTSCER